MNNRAAHRSRARAGWGEAQNFMHYLWPEENQREIFPGGKGAVFLNVAWELKSWQLNYILGSFRILFPFCPGKISIL